MRRYVPRQILPTAIEAQYAKKLVKRLVPLLRSAYMPVVTAVRKNVIEAKRAKFLDAKVRKDASDDWRVRALMQQAKEHVAKNFDLDELADLADEFGTRTADHQDYQLKRQARHVMGADPTFNDEGLDERLGTFVRHNVTLVSRIPSDFHDELSDIIEQGAREAWQTDDIAEEIEDRFGIAERHARLIARDQIGGLYADVNHERQRSIGVERFVWRCVNDERVRGNPDGKYPNAIPSHWALDGNVYSYDDPPQPDGADAPILPGDEICCRCWAEPVLDDLLDSSDDDDEGDEDDDSEPDVEVEDRADSFDLLTLKRNDLDGAIQCYLDGAGPDEARMLLMLQDDPTDLMKVMQEIDRGVKNTSNPLEASKKR